MKKLVSILSVLLFIFTFANAGNYAYVDIEKVMNQSVKGKKYKADLDAKYKYYSEKAKSLQNKMQEIQKQLQNPSLTEKAKQDKMAELRETARQLQALEIEANQTLAKMKADSEKAMLRDIEQIAQKIAKEKNLDIIFYSGLLSGVLYADKSLDITDEILKRYNEGKK